MARIARCKRCGEPIDERWTTKERCPSCGGEIERVGMDLGPMERLPRYLKWAGALLLATAGLLFLTVLIGLTSVSFWVIFPLSMGSMVLLVSSLACQKYIADKALVLAPEPRPRRVQRRIRGSETVRESGRTGADAGGQDRVGRPKASKVLVRSR